MEIQWPYSWPVTSNCQGYRFCLASVLSHTGNAAAVKAKTISDNMITSVKLQRPRMTPVLPRWDLGIVLGALSRPPYEPLREASLKHLTLKTVFLLAMASARRCSELQALVFDPEYIHSKEKGAGVTLYFSPEFMLRYYYRYMTEPTELRKGTCRHRLFIPIRDNNAGRSLVLHVPLFLCFSSDLHHYTGFLCHPSEGQSSRRLGDGPVEAPSRPSTLQTFLHKLTIYNDI